MKEVKLNAEQQAREDEIMDATYRLLEVLAGEEDGMSYHDIGPEVAVHVAEVLCASGREVYWPMVVDTDRKTKGLHIVENFPLSEEEKEAIIAGRKKDEDEIEFVVRVKSTYGEFKKMLEKGEY